MPRPPPPPPSSPPPAVGPADRGGKLYIEDPAGDEVIYQGLQMTAREMATHPPAMDPQTPYRHFCQCPAYWDRARRMSWSCCRSDRRSPLSIELKHMGPPCPDEPESLNADASDDECFCKAAVVPWPRTRARAVDTRHKPYFFYAGKQLHQPGVFACCRHSLAASAPHLPVVSMRPLVSPSTE